jgi:sterol-4alpha-carboxylate 3-dehydrogenase (decarboxylating)
MVPLSYVHKHLREAGRTSKKNSHAAHLPESTFIMGSIILNGPILVFGGCGFLGHHLVNRLLSTTPNTHIVTVVDLATDRNRHPSANYRVANITQRDEVAKVFQEIKPQVVFHMVSPNPFEGDHSLLEKVNVVGTQHLIECAKAVGTVRAIVYTSSSSLVHNQRQPMVEATEDLPVLFRPEQPEFYSHTKALAESMVLAANREGGMLTASIRPAALYGPRDNMMSTNLTNQALRGRANIRFGKGQYLYDTCYVENCVDAQILLVQALLQAGPSAPLAADEKVEGEAFFVTNDEHIPFWDVQRLIAELAGLPVQDQELKCIPVWLIMAIASFGQWVYWICSLGRKQPMLTTWVVRLTTMERTLCITKIKKRLGYKPRFSNQEGWVKTLEWALPALRDVERNKAS